jgi:hypothetical protein
VDQQPNTQKKPQVRGLWRPAFLTALAEVGNVKEAAKLAGIHRTTAFRAKNADPQFAKKWAEAEQEAADLLEKEAWRRATEGTDEPVFYKGDQCGSIKRYSDNLLMFLLRGARPEKYRERFLLPVAELDKLIEREISIARGETEPDETTETTEIVN